MVSVYYNVFLIISVVMALIYIYVWHKHFDIHISLVFAFILLQDMGYVFLINSVNLGEALLANKIIYLAGCCNILFVMLSVFNLCHIRLSRILRLGFFALSGAQYCCVLNLGKSDLFYREVSFEIVDGAGTFIGKEYGPLHTLFFAIIGLYLFIPLVVLIYCQLKKKNTSRKITHMLFATIVISVLSFFAGRAVTDKVDMLPVSNLISEIIFFMIIHRICLYDITDYGIDSLIEKGNTGFISFDFKYNYLDSNETARKIFPELETLTVDKSIMINEKFSNLVTGWLDSFKTNESDDKRHYKKDEKIYLIDINYLFDGKKKRGYQFVISDDTKDQKYIALMNKFNTSLKEQVNRKTNHILEMHDNLIMSMAAMVESRDNSTGGHIKRTSRCVKILIDEIKKNNVFNLSEEFCRNIIKAAPMHDLGKIAVDDAVLRKPGRFEPEEFEKMKKHAAEGARIVSEILKSTDNASFRIVAENVAHYHHERWDGSGYPEGLKAERIPLEARIMAIADVYDALVSKRVYKESMSFEQADAIIMEGMGKHFDKRLEPFYIAARPKLEEYYKNLL